MNTQKPTVPFLDLKAIHEPYLEEFCDIARHHISNAAFIGGDSVEKFEEEFANYCGVSNSIGCGNGTDAIELVLRGMGIGLGDEVIIPANTFYATLEAVEAAGARPVLVDCQEGTWQIDPEAAEAAITPKTSAIIAVHLYGHPAPMGKLRAVADRHGIALIEDAAQAHGAKWKDKRVGSLGDAAAFSFYPGKNLGACGDGGAVTTDDVELAGKVRSLSQHGQSKKYYHHYVGRNSRLDSLQASFLSRKLVDLDRDNRKRRSAANCYLWEMGELHEHLRLPDVDVNVEPVFHLFVVHLEKRNEMEQQLKQRGVITGFHYPVACHLQDGSSHLGYKEGQFPNAEYNAANCLSLPISPTITSDQVLFVASQIRSVLGQKQPNQNPVTA